MARLPLVLLCSLACSLPALAAERECFAPDDCDGDGSLHIDFGGDDCDDDNPLRYPGNLEVCDAEGLDEDCNPDTLGGRDLDGDGFVSDQCCNLNDYNGQLVCGDDCDDSLFTTNPFAAEVCNAVDDNCDGQVDEGLAQSWYADGDGDGFGSGAATETCFPLTGYVHNASDCDDAQVAVVPGAQVCHPDGSVGVCQASGAYVSAECASGLSCVEQPNGTGVCQWRPGNGNGNGNGKGNGKGNGR